MANCNWCSDDFCRCGCGCGWPFNSCGCGCSGTSVIPDCDEEENRDCGCNRTSDTIERGTAWTSDRCRRDRSGCGCKCGCDCD